MGTLVSVAHFPLLASLDSNGNAQSTKWQFLLRGQSLVLVLLFPLPALPTALSVFSFLGPSFGLPDKEQDRLNGCELVAGHSRLFCLVLGRTGRKLQDIRWGQTKPGRHGRWVARESFCKDTLSRWWVNLRYQEE